MVTKNRYYRRSRISEAKFRQLVRCFAMDLTATVTAEMTGISLRSVNTIYLKIAFANCGSFIVVALASSWESIAIACCGFAEFIAIASCASQQVVAIMCADCWASLRSLLRARGIIAITFAIHGRFIMVALTSSLHRRSRSCDFTEYFAITSRRSRSSSRSLARLI